MHSDDEQRRYAWTVRDWRFWVAIGIALVILVGLLLAIFWFTGGAKAFSPDVPGPLTSTTS